MRRRWTRQATSLLAAALFGALGCEGRGCEDAPAVIEAEIAPPRRAAEMEVSVVPRRARAVVRAERLAPLVTLLDSVIDRLEPTSSVALTRTEWIATLGFDPLEAEAWSPWGIDPEGRAIAFHDEGMWALSLGLRTPDAFERWALEMEQAGRLSRSTTTLGSWRLHRLSLPAEKGGSPLAHILLRDDEILVVPRGRLQPQPAVESAVPPRSEGEIDALSRYWTSLTPATTWRMEGLPRALRERLLRAEGEVIAVVRPGAWIRELPASGHARALVERMASQIGPTGLSASLDAPARRLQLEIFGSQDPGEPVFIEELRGAQGPAPRIGALAGPGVLGVARLSVDPLKLYALVRSMLPADQRAELDEVLRDYRAELQVDLQRDLLENLTGHAVAVIYGFETEVFTEENPRLIADLLTLRATREALLLPVRDVDAIREILDVSTQLSKGKLNRQAVGETVQYAWIEEGSLDWAVVLGEDHVVLVDSTAAFDHALAFARGPRELAPALARRGLDALFEGSDRSGLYLDAESLANLLGESGSAALATWLKPFASILLTTEMEGAISRTRVQLVLDQPPE